MTGRHSTRRYGKLTGLCYDDNKLYCLGWQGNSPHWLAVYETDATEDGSLRLLGSAWVGDVPTDCRPRVDSFHRVYVPCHTAGVRVFHYQNGSLLPAREPLRCVWTAISIAVNTLDTVYVCNWEPISVCVVSVSADTVIRQLERPAQVPAPRHIAVLGETALVCYGDNTLVLYDSNSLTSDQVLRTPEGLEEVTSVTTDSFSSSFLVTDRRAVFVLDDKGLWHRIYTGDYGLVDCVVAQSQLWLG